MNRGHPHLGAVPQEHQDCTLTCMLYGLAKSGQAPQIFALLLAAASRWLLLATTLVAALFTSLIGDGSAYTWLVNASGLAGFITWAGIALSHYKFRKAYVAQGNDLVDLPFRAAFFPYWSALWRSP